MQRRVRTTDDMRNSTHLRHRNGERLALFDDEHGQKLRGRAAGRLVVDDVGLDPDRLAWFVGLRGLPIDGEHLLAFQQITEHGAWMVMAPGPGVRRNIDQRVLHLVVRAGHVGLLQHGSLDGALLCGRGLLGVGRAGDGDGEEGDTGDQDALEHEWPFPWGHDSKRQRQRHRRSTRRCNLGVGHVQDLPDLEKICEGSDL